MKVKLYLISNNVLLDGLRYKEDANLEVIRMLRPLSVKGEEVASKISNIPLLSNVNRIYSSFHSSALGSAKYLAEKLEMNINMNNLLNDCKVGTLGSKNMQMVKGLQDHEFTYKLPNGESLIDVGKRIETFIKLISSNEEVAVFTHKRAILGYLLKYAKVGYNLDENLILEYNDNLIYDDSDTLYNIYEVIIEDNEVKDIKVINI